ncbi:MAG: zinc ribbon domain-containing protein [Thermoplasmata archaeon]
MAKKCPHCSFDLPQSANYCPKCGYLVAPEGYSLPVLKTYCPRCGTEILQDTLYCYICGTRRIAELGDIPVKDIAGSEMTEKKSLNPGVPAAGIATKGDTFSSPSTSQQIDRTPITTPIVDSTDKGAGRYQEDRPSTRKLISEMDLREKKEYARKAADDACSNPAKAGESMDILMNLIYDTSHQVREAAIKAIGRIARVSYKEAEIAVPPLLERINDRDKFTRIEALKTLAVISEYDKDTMIKTREKLFFCLRDEDHGVRYRSAVIIGELARKYPYEFDICRSVLKKMAAEDPMQANRAEAEVVLKILNEQIPDPPKNEQKPATPPGQKPVFDDILPAAGVTPFSHPSQIGTASADNPTVRKEDVNKLPQIISAREERYPVYEEATPQEQVLEPESVEFEYVELIEEEPPPPPPDESKENVSDNEGDIRDKDDNIDEEAFFEELEDELDKSLSSPNGVNTKINTIPQSTARKQVPLSDNDEFYEVEAEPADMDDGNDAIAKIEKVGQTGYRKAGPETQLPGAERPDEQPESIMPDRSGKVVAKVAKPVKKPVSPSSGKPPEVKTIRVKRMPK